MKIKIYVNEDAYQIEWAVQENFSEIMNEKFYIFDMKAETIMEKYHDISEYSRILLSAVAGAVIQYLIDNNVSLSADIYFVINE